MTWLSEIEKYAEIYPDVDVVRMARVIRELVGRMRTAKVICAVTTKETEPQIMFDAITDILGLLKDDFSPDARELLE